MIRHEFVCGTTWMHVQVCWMCNMWVWTRHYRVEKPIWWCDNGYHKVNDGAWQP